ncbi:MAG: hypothetical protein PVH65_14890 [Chloroflexota bacterium]|jgi:hypothetical protein
MDDNSRRSIRRLLKTFGIKADEAMIAYLARNPEINALPVRITLESQAGDGQPAEALRLVVEDTITRE